MSEENEVTKSSVEEASRLMVFLWQGTTMLYRIKEMSPHWVPFQKGLVTDDEPFMHSTIQELTALGYVTTKKYRQGERADLTPAGRRAKDRK